MHLRRAARTLVAALFAALLLLAPATAGAYTINTPTATEGQDLDFEVSAELGELPRACDPQPGTAEEETDFAGEPVDAGTDYDVPTRQDNIDEPDETVKLVCNEDEDFGTIKDDDPQPALSISDVSAGENAGRATLMIAAPNPSSRDIDITLGAPQGDLRVPPTVTLPALATSVEVPVTITNDPDDELDEQVAVTIAGTTAGADVADGEGIVTIVNDDLRTADLVDASTPEGDGGTSNAQFSVRLNGPTFRRVTVRYLTNDGTAQAPGDYLARLGSVTFAPGQTSVAVDVPVVGDDAEEGSEVFGLRLTEADGARLGDAVGVGVIIDDDSASPGGGSTPGGGPGPGGGGGGATAGDVMPPKITLGPPKASGSRVTMRVSCPRDEESCEGRISLYTAPDRRAKARTLRRERRVGRKSFTVKGGRSKTVSITIPGSILSAARRSGRLKLKAFALTQDAEGNFDTRVRRGTLSYGKRRSRSR